jgi:LytTr DNA-binding domain-containing protein
MAFMGPEAAADPDGATPPRGLSLSPRRAAFWGAWAAMLAFAAVTNALSTRADFARHGIAVRPFEPFVWEATSAIATFALLPALVWWVDRRPWSRGASAATIGWNALAALLFSALHVLGMVAMRHAAYALAGSRYDFGPWRREFVYELRKDIVTFVVLSAAINFLREIERRIAAPVIAPAAAADVPAQAVAVLRIRDGSAELALEATRILAVRAAGNYVEIFGVQDRPLLVRATLAEVEERVAPLGICRVHRSWLVALDRVERVSTTSAGDFRLELAGGLEAPGSRRHRQVIEPLRSQPRATGVPRILGR